MQRIFVAEDEKDIRELLMFTLEYAGYAVRVFANAEELLHHIDNELPDLFILDVRMPGMSGFELCQQLKQDPRSQAIPVIFLSSKGQKEEIMTGFAVGAIEYILKPFVPQELNARVTQILGGVLE